MSLLPSFARDHKGACKRAGRAIRKRVLWASSEGYTGFIYRFDDHHSITRDGQQGKSLYKATVYAEVARALELEVDVIKTPTGGVVRVWWVNNSATPKFQKHRHWHSDEFT